MLECLPLEVTMPVSRNLTHSTLHWDTAQRRSLYTSRADAKPNPNGEQIINFLFSSRLMEWARHQRSGPHPWNIARCTSLKLELSLQLKRKNLVSALLAFVHSLVTTFPILYTSLSSYSPTTVSLATIIPPTMAQQDILSPIWSQLQHFLRLLHHLADPLGDLIAHLSISLSP